MKGNAIFQLSITKNHSVYYLLSTQYITNKMVNIASNTPDVRITCL